MGNFSVCGLPAGSLFDTTGGGGAVARGEEEKWETEREDKKIQRPKERKRELHCSLCSLNEVFFLFFCVCMVALSVDDGCVGIGCIVRSFGLVCQVRSFMPGQVSSQNND